MSNSFRVKVWEAKELLLLTIQNFLTSRHSKTQSLDREHQWKTKEMSMHKESNSTAAHQLRCSSPSKLCRRIPDASKTLMRLHSTHPSFLSHSSRPQRTLQGSTKCLLMWTSLCTSVKRFPQQSSPMTSQNGKKTTNPILGWSSN